MQSNGHMRGLPEKTCVFCDYTWTPRKEVVRECPACKRYFKIEK